MYKTLTFTEFVENYNKQSYPNLLISNLLERLISRLEP